jgi:LysR family glycine cleavage system transcriptional activator
MPLHESSIRGLRAFCSAAKHLSFKAAAREVCVTPSAVSHRIKALEERLQTPLFDRRARKLVLTVAGADLLAAVEPILRELEHVTRGFMADRSGR